MIAGGAVIQRRPIWKMGLALLGLWAGPAAATDDLVTGQIDQVSQVQESDYGFGSGSFVVAPIPFKNPTIGNGLALGGGYLFSFDEGSDTSVLGLGALRSSNGSQAYGAMVNLNWADNRWGVSAFAGTADLRYDLFVLGEPFPLKQSGSLARGTFRYGVTQDLSFGLMLQYLDTDISGDFGRPLPIELEPAAHLEILNAGLVADLDKRDDDIYPRRGYRIYGEVAHGFVLDGLAQDFDKAYATFDGYLPIGQRGVIAGRLTLCGASPEAPFYEQCSLGGTDAFRGYSSTEFLDERLVSAQVEYRHQISNRLGAVAFAGTGATGGGFDDLDAAKSAGGLGVRYRVSKKFPLDFSVDASWNQDQESQVYIYVGQRF